MDAVLTYARTSGARRLWLVTTNDNVRAIGFYRRWVWTWRPPSTTASPPPGG